MGERRGTKALETWCRRVTQGYPGVKVENMTTSWRDGLAFCALIHHFRPDLIDFSRLDKSDVYGNNELAFRIAERHLGIPALLDAEDMAEYPVPDRLSILTYLSQFYQAFASNSSSPVKKASTDSPDGSLVSLVQGNVQPPPKMEWSARGREPCAVCKLPVFIAQRLRVEGRLYHRTCFRCARCGAQLSPADCYETCAGEFVCETCPDEMAAPEETTEPTAAIRMGSPTPPPSPSVPPPPAAPPEPPPSLVAMRRLMFDTDDAKLMKHDHAVNTTRIAHSIKKDLSTNVDSRSYIDKEEANSVNIDVDKSEDLPKNPEIDSSPKNSKRLDQCVNSSTIPASSSHPESARDSNAIKTGPCLIEGKDISVKLDINSSMEEPLDIRQDTLSFNDSPNITCEDNLASHSESDLKIEPSDDIKTSHENEVKPEPSDDTKTSNENEVKPEPSDDIKTSNENEVKPAVREKVIIHSCHPEIKSVDIEPPSVSNEEVKDVSPKEEEKKVTPMKSEYPTDLNPFGDSEEEEEEDNNKEPNTSRVSTNPFGSDSEEEEQPVVKPPPRSTPRKMSISMRSTASTNPFESDEEDDVEKPPVPLPRQSLQSSPEPTPFPRRSRLRTSARSITSLSSIGSYSSTSPRKKRPAPPPPTGQSATLSPSSRYSSVSSLNRPRKNKRAPLPPTSIQTSPSKTNDSTPDTSLVSEGHISIPQIEVVQPPETDEANAKITGELAAQIEEGMKKLMAHNSNDAIHEPIQSTLYEESKSQSSPPSMDMNSLPGISIENEPLPTVISTEPEPLPPVISKESESPLTGEDHSLEVIATKDSESTITSKEEKDTINKSSKAGVLIDEDDNVTKSAIDNESRDKMQADIHVNEENQNNKNVPKDKVELTDTSVNKEENIIDEEQYCDKLIENIEDTEHIKLEKTEELVETFNEVLISNSKNGSVIKFEEIDHPAHSTPVKTDISLSKLGTSLDDVHSGNSFFGTPYLSSPSASCADTSSYQESLSSPPTEKRYKDSANMHRKISESGVFHPHKSMYGQWKRKKAPAPPLPMPQKRIIKPMAIQRIRQELTDIEIKQQELERQGVSLEQKIRERFDSDTSITPYLEDLVLQLFELVNEKNELFRKQAELMYLRRQHQLEEEHAELEFQIRCLMARPEANKTDSDKELEEKLIQRLVEVVERRDAIVQCLEMDRLREVEEDKSINSQLDQFTRAIVTDERMKVKKKYKKKKEKHNTMKMMDLDKDFDESEKESKKKKRWYTLHHKMTKNL